MTDVSEGEGRKGGRRFPAEMTEKEQGNASLSDRKGAVETPWSDKQEAGYGLLGATTEDRRRLPAGNDRQNVQRYLQIAQGDCDKGLSVQSMLSDVAENGWRDEFLACLVGVAGVEAGAEGCGAYGVGDVWQEMEAGALGGGEAVERWWGEAGAADDDPVGEVEESVGLVPAMEGVEGVST